MLGLCTYSLGQASYHDSSGLQPAVQASTSAPEALVCSFSIRIRVKATVNWWVAPHASVCRVHTVLGTQQAAGHLTVQAGTAGNTA